jgi:hypothetical protein
VMVRNGKALPCIVGMHCQRKRGKRENTEESVLDPSLPFFRLFFPGCFPNTTRVATVGLHTAFSVYGMVYNVS